MAGSLYLGSQKVCPAVVVGKQEPVEYDSLIKVPDDMTVLEEHFFELSSGWSNCNIKTKLLLDLNNIETIADVQSGAFSNFFPEDCINMQIDIRAEKLRIAGDGAFNGFIDTYSKRQLPVAYNPIIRFPNVETVGLLSFGGFVYSGVTDVFFPKLKDSDRLGFAACLICVKNAVTLHFPSNKESLISSLSGYPNFSSKYPVTILYDQPATE